jgi:hypothetical protein
MIQDHTQIEREKRVACRLMFPMYGVYRFESSRLSDKSTACLWQSSRRQLNELNEFVGNCCCVARYT